MSAFSISMSAQPVARLWNHVHQRLPTALALALPVAAFFLTGDVGLNLGDEGFLWYGAQRVLVGEVPLRDFQSYDIGRYYWSAGWMLLTGSTGIMSLRAGNAVLAAINVVIAVRLIRAGGQHRLSLQLFAALTFAMLMVPQEKMADSFAALLLVAGLATALRRPQDTRAWAGAGMCLGLAGVIGINHGLYGTIGGLLGGLYLVAVRGQAIGWRLQIALAIGLTIGYAPVLAFHVLVPGFTDGFIDTVRQLFEAGTTNLTLPLPKASRILDALTMPSARHEAKLAALFIAAPLFLLACAARLYREDAATPPREANSIFTAAALMSVPYAHYAYSRADIVHVVVSALPLLVAAWTFVPRRWPLLNRAVLTVLALGCTQFMFREHPAYMVLSGAPLKPIRVHGERLRLPPQAAYEVEGLLRLTEMHAAKRNFYVAAYWPGVYAVAGRRSPVWEIYPLFLASAERQRREIERLRSADIALALITAWRMDGRTDFDMTHPLLGAYVRRCMRKLDAVANPMPEVRAYVADGPRCATP